MSEILLDGWPLIHAPNSPAALHILTLCAAGGSDFQPVLALPGETPAWLGGRIRALNRPCVNTPAARLGWEQQTLPVLARFAGAARLHTTAPSGPLFSQVPLLHSPTWPPGARQPGAGLVERLRQSLGAGGLANARTLWPADLPVPAGLTVELVEPLLETRYLQALAGEKTAAGALAQLELPESFVVYHGPLHPAALEHLLDAWSWAAGPLGEYYPLLVLGAGAADAAAVKRLQQAERVLACPTLPPAALAQVYARCSALFQPHPGAPWGDPLRWALSFGKPAAAARTPFSEAVCGPAGYLPPPNDPRAMGAALISLLVQEDLSDQLSAAARRRPPAWQAAGGRSLAEVYRNG